MSKQLFDENGRCVPDGVTEPVYETSRRYFLCEPPSLDLDAIYGRLATHLGEPADLGLEDFRSRVEAILADLSADEATANVAKGVYIPFFLPADSNLDDIGAALEARYLPAVDAAFCETVDGYDFEAQVKSGLEGKLSIIAGSRHEQVIEKLKSETVVGIYFPALSEYSTPAAFEKVSQLPEKFHLNGGVDLCAVFIAQPDLLIREEGYPPLLWMSALQGDSDKIGYHFESYGFNLKFYRRSHLGQVAEYWWHGLTVLG